MNFQRAIIDAIVKSQNNPVPRGRGRCRRRYRKLIRDLLDPDTDSDPDADKAGMVLFTVSSLFNSKNAILFFRLTVRD